MPMLSRRECLLTLASASVALRLPSVAGAATTGKTLRGAFMILNTPFTATGDGRLGRPRARGRVRRSRAAARASSGRRDRAASRR